MAGPRIDLDPACVEAAALREKHRSQRSLFLHDLSGPSRLRDILQARQTNDLIDHKVGCDRCGPYQPPCASCGRSAVDGHKFFCPDNKHRWRGLFGRKKPAPVAAAEPLVHITPEAPGAPARHVVAPLATQPGATTRPLGGHHRGPATRAPPQPAAPQPAAPRPAARPKPSARPPPAAPPSARPQPAAKPDAPPRPAAPAGPAPPPPRAQAPPPPPPKQAPPKRPSAPAPTSPNDPLVVLGLDPTAMWDEIKTTYRQKVKQYHPDKVSHLAPEFREVAEERMRAINVAYDLLRKRFDA